MVNSQSIPPVLPSRRVAIRRGILLAIAVCLLFHFLLFSGCLDFVWQHFNSNVFFVVGVLVETLIVFCILYRTPLLSEASGRGAGIGRVILLVVLAYCFVFGVMMTVAILWFIACAIFGIPGRDV